MSAVVHVNILSKPGHEQELAAGIVAAQKLTQNEAKCQHAAVWRDLDDARQLVIHEVWDAREDYEAFNARIVQLPEVAQLFAMIEGEPQYTFYEGLS